MTKISAIYDAFVTIMGTVLPSYAQIPNAYEIGDNANLFLQKGFAVAVGPAVNTNRLVGCKMSVQRTVSVLITNQLTASITDSNGIGSVVKSLLEDHYSLIREVEKDPTLLGSASAALYSSDGGIEYLTAGQAKYLLCELAFDVEYFENL